MDLEASVLVPCEHSPSSAGTSEKLGGEFTVIRGELLSLLNSKDT